MLVKLGTGVIITRSVNIAASQNAEVQHRSYLKFIKHTYTSPLSVAFESEKVSRGITEPRCALKISKPRMKPPYIVFDTKLQ